MMPYHACITDKKHIAKDTWEITFQCFEVEPPNIEAGQYVRIVVPEITGGARENSRILSVIMFRSSTSKHWGVVFRTSESAFKKYIIGALVGTKVIVYGPFGDFTLPKCLDSQNLNVVFIAGGVGIAPFLSMARLATEEKLPHRILLLYANKDEQSAAYLSELVALERENKNFTLRHKIGLLDEEFIKQNLKDFQSVVRCQWSDVLFYIAGPSAMVAQTKNILLQMGIASSRIRTEAFGV